jgi:RimJ/RimL family protein N-acetyltransferase
MSNNLFPIETKHFFILAQNEEKPLEEGWNVCLKDGDQNKIGSISFEDAVLHGELQISVMLEPEFNKADYNKEIFFAMSNFAFQSDNVREISTKCNYEEENRVRGLEKAGYVRRETIDGIHHYSIKKQKSSWTGVYVFVGLIAGFIIGITVSNLWMGTAIGVVSGIIVGLIMDKRDSEPERQ